MQTKSPEPGSSDQRRFATSALRVLLWLAFAGLFLAMGWLWLRACGTNSIFGLSRDFCPASADHSTLEHEAALGRHLMEEVHQAEMKVAETPICPLPPPPKPVPPPLKPVVLPPPVPLEPVKPPPDDRVTQHDRDTIQKRADKRGAKTGKLQITLTWETRDDLDLTLYCPGGKISSYEAERGPGICGDGTKDVDANRNATAQATTTPVENIFFKSDVPAGSYSIVVIEFWARKTKIANQVPYKLRIRWNDQEQFCSGVVTWVAEDSRTKDSDGPIAGLYQTLTWTIGDALPKCSDIKSETAHLTAPNK